MTEKENPITKRIIAGLEIKLDVATTLLHKANFEQQIAVLLAGKNTAAVAKIRAEYNATKAKIFADAEAEEKKKAAEAAEEAAEAVKDSQS